MAESGLVTIEWTDPRRSETTVSPHLETKPTHEALESILAGTAQLAEEQSVPPLALLSEVLAMSGHVESLGPRSPNDSVYTKNLEKLTLRDVRRDIVDGHAVLWREGPPSIKMLAENLWRDQNGQRPTILGQLKLVFQMCLPKHAKMQRQVSFTDEDLGRELSVRVPPGDGDPANWYYRRRLSGAWYEFQLGLQELEAKLYATVDQGILEGRILAFKKRDAADIRFLPTESYATSSDAKYWYILTRDLPESWFPETSPTGKATSQARRWIEKLDAKIYATGKIMTAEDAVALMVEYFRLSEAAAKRAWKDAKLAVVRYSGRVKDAQRISRMEIKEKFIEKSVL